MKVNPESLVGAPFVCLPGRPPDHKVLRTFVHGGKEVKLRVRDVETVWNDAALIDAVRGAGEYETSSLVDYVQQVAFGVAVMEYGRYPKLPTIRRKGPAEAVKGSEELLFS